MKKDNNQSAVPARQIATQTLDSYQEQNTFAEIILNAIIHKTDQKQQTTDLVFGTIRNQALIDEIILQIANTTPDKTDSKIFNIMRIAVYELIYCPQTAAYAILNDAVNNAKIAGTKSHAGFVNACLRNISRQIENRSTTIKDAPAQKIIPQNPDTGCLFKDNILPNPEENPQQYLAIAFSIPIWLINKWLKYIDFKNVKNICLASARKPSLFIRTNTIKTTPQKIAQALEEQNIHCQIIEPAMIKLKSPANIESLPGFKDGLFSIQDLSAAIPAQLLNPKPFSKILDLCAAPGTKTAQLAEITNNNAKIFATDINPKRLHLIRKNVERLKLKNVTVFKYDDIKRIISQHAPFDYILLDVPCSNTGVLAKRPEARYRITKSDLKELTKTQYEIITQAAKYAAKNTILCYSTCSILHEENQEIITKFIKTNPNFTIITEKLTFPSSPPKDHDGGYFAILQKTK